MKAKELYRALETELGPLLATHGFRKRRHLNPESDTMTSLVRREMFAALDYHTSGEGRGCWCGADYELTYRGSKY